MCMSCGKGGTKSNSYTPKKMATAKTSTSTKQSSVMKSWGGTGSAYGSPKVGKISFGKR